jgi:transposase
MARPKMNIDSETVLRAEKELARMKDGKLTIQLKAIIASAEHPVESIADVLKVSTRSIFRWITKFKEGGVEGLRDRPKGHMRSKLTEDQQKQIEQWIVGGKNAQEEVVHWTLKRLKKELKKEMEIKITTTPLWKHLKKMGLVLKKPARFMPRQTESPKRLLKKT